MPGLMQQFALAPAHLPLPGLEGLVAGFLHPFTEIDQALAVVASGLLLGQQPRPVLGRAWPAFPLAFLAGIAGGLLCAPPNGAEIILHGCALLAGGLVALAPRLPATAVSAVEALAGLGVGVAVLPAPGGSAETAITLLGLAAGVHVLLLYSFGGASWVLDDGRWPWLGIGLRIIGSWIAAVSLLMISLTLGR